MPIEFRCTKCSKLLRVPDDAAGRKAQCPNCETILQIPADVGQGTPGVPPSGPGSREQSIAGSAPLPSQTGQPSSSLFDEVEIEAAEPRGPASDNPFQSPLAAMGRPGHLAAPGRVNAPATGLIVVGIIGIVLQSLSLMIILFVGHQLWVGNLPQAGNNPAFEFMGSIAFNIGSAVVSLARSALLIYAGLQMKQLRNYGIAMTAAILAIVPCFSACCLLDLPFGIWALVVLCQSDVKAAFNRTTIML